MCVVMVDTIFVMIVAVVLFVECVFLVQKPILVFKALFTGAHVLVEKAIVIMLVLSGTTFRFLLVEIVVLHAAVVLTLLNARTALKMNTIEALSVLTKQTCLTASLSITGRWSGCTVLAINTLRCA